MQVVVKIARKLKGNWTEPRLQYVLYFQRFSYFNWRMSNEKIDIFPTEAVSYSSYDFEVT